jgi:hypothetical protein
VRLTRAEITTAAAASVVSAALGGVLWLELPHHTVISHPPVAAGAGPQVTGSAQAAPDTGRRGTASEQPAAVALVRDQRSSATPSPEADSPQPTAAAPASTAPAPTGRPSPKPAPGPAAEAACVHVLALGVCVGAGAAPQP